MTTFAVPRDQAVADAFAAVIARLSRGRNHEAVAAAQEMRNAATPGSGFHVAHVPFEVRPEIAGAARQLAGLLTELADGLDPHAPAGPPVPAPAPARAPGG